MTNKLKISEKNSEKLDDLSKRLYIRRNIVCRLAIGRSIAEEDFEEDFFNNEFQDSDGYEFNLYTLTGEYDKYYKALIVQAHGKNISDEDYSKKYLKEHIERGIALLFKEYQRVRSRTTFFKKLANNNF